MDLKIFLSAFLLFGVLGSISTAPTTGRCVSECIPAVNPKFNYAQGKVYQYTYQTESGLSVVGTIKETPSYKVTANAEFHAVSPCELVLKLTNVQLTGSFPVPTAGDFKKALESKPLLFSHTDGRVENVCADAQDPSWVVNFKRAVISTFQNSMDNGLETHNREIDVLGQCNTHYTIKGATIDKTKDILSCTSRTGNISALQADHYASYSDIQTFPLLETSYHCTHTIADQVTKEVVCHETNRYRPYSKGDKAATVTTTNKLTLTKSAKSTVAPPANTVRTSLLFDHHDENAIKADVQDTNNVLKKLCKNYESVEITDDAASQFTRLVFLVRRLSKDQLKNILQNIPKTCPESESKLKDTFMSALVGAATEHSAAVLYDLTKTTPVTPLRLRLWSLSFAFVRNPSLNFVKLVADFVTGASQFDSSVELSSSTILHNYCRQNTDCQNEEAIKKVVNFFGSRLQKKCVTNSEEEEDKIISALKGFGNIGRVGSFTPTIVECIKNPAVKTTIRLAAVESFRRIPEMDDANGLKLFEVLRDVTQDTEVRIALYLFFASHPDPRFYKHVSYILEHEVVNQVSSFIWTHIRNLRQTESPLKQKHRELAEDVDLQKKFHNDFRKFSRNYDASFFSDKYNIGADLESNVIFSPESFLPRSTSLNLTVDLFGSAINVFELDMRAENFEYALEKYFGPAGKVATTDKLDLLKSYKTRLHKIAEGIESQTSHRRKRELPYKVQRLREIQDKAGFKPSNQPEGSLSLKVFGNELIYRHFHKLDDFYDRNDPHNLQDIFNKLAKHKEFDVARNWMFMDATYSVPTASGLPLRLNLNGTISVGLKLKSHFDVRQLFLKPRSCDIKSFIQPSANIQTGVALYLDAHVSKTGIKYEGNIYSSGAIDGTFQLKQGESLIANLDFPTPTQRFFKLETRAFVVQNDAETPATFLNTKRYEIHGCTPGKSGLQLCSDISLPKPLFDENRPYIPMGGPIKYQSSLSKKDAGLQGIHFTAVWKREKGDGDEIKNTELKLSLDTPGSSTPREYTLDYQLNRVDNLLRFNIRSPKFKVGLNGNYIDQDAKKEATLKLNINDERQYSISGKTNIATTGGSKVYDGVWEISHPNAPTTKITGKITRTIGKKVEFDIKTDASSPKQISLKGFVQRDGPLDLHQTFTASCDVNVVLPIIQTKIVGSFENHHEEFENKHKLDLNVDYTLKSEGQKRNFLIKTDCETKLDREAHEFRLKRDIEFRSSRLPQCNTKTKILIEKIQQEYHSLLDAKWGDNLDDPNKKIFYEHTHKYKLGGRGAYEGHGQITFVYPRRAIDWSLDSKVNYQPKKALEYDLELKYGQGKTVKVALDYKNLTQRLDNYEAELKITLPTREIVIRDKLNEKAKGEYTGETYIQWQKGEYVTINSLYKNKGGPDLIHHEAEVTVLLGTQTSPIRKYKFLFHGEPNKYQLNGRVEKPDTTYVVDAIYDLPASGSANFNLNLKVPWIEGKVTSKRVPGDFQGNADLTTFTGRKVVGSAGLKGTGLNKALTAELKWDAAKDPSKKFSLNANIERPRRRAATVKGTLSIPNHNFKGTIDYDLPQTLFNGPHNIFADVEYAPGKKVTFDGKFNIDRTESGRRHSTGKIVYSSPNVQNWKLDYHTDFHNHPDERTFKADFTVDCPKHGHYGGEIEYLRGYRKFSTSVEAQYGEGKAVRLGVGTFMDLGGHGHGYDIGGKFELKTPFPGFQDLAITMRDAFHHTYEAGHFVTDHHVRWAPGKEVGLTIEYDRIHKHGESFELSGKIEVDTPFEKYPHQKLDVDIIFDRNPRVLLHSKIDAEWGIQQSVKSQLHYSRDGPTIDTSLFIDGEIGNGQLYLDSKFSNDVSADGYSSHASLKGSDGKALTLDGQVTVSGDKKLVDISISSPWGTVKTITVKGDLTRKGNQRSADLTGTWAPGKTINFKGDLTSDDTGSFKGDLKVNSNELGLKDVAIGVERKLGGPKRSYGVHFNFGPDRDIKLGLDVADKADKTGITGTGKVKINGEEFLTSNIDIIDAPTKKNYFGRLLQFTSEVKNPSLAFTTKVVLLSDKGINPTLQICSVEGENCFKFEALLDLDKWDPKVGPIDNTVYFKFTVQDGPGKSRTAGIIGRTYRLRNNKEVSLKVILNEEQNKFIGISYQKSAKDDPKKPDPKKVYQLILPTRTMEIRSEKTYNNQGYVYNIHVLADSVKAPNKELLITSDVKISSDEKAYTRITKIAVKHPKLTKDLAILSNIVKGGSGNKVIFKQKLDLDLSKDPAKKMTIEIEVLDEPKFNNGHNYTGTFSIRQPAYKNLDFKIQGHRGRSNEARTLGLALTWVTKDGKPYVLSFFNSIDKVLRTVNGYVHTPVRHISWDGDYQKFEDGGIPTIRANLDLLYNNKVVRSAAIEYSRGPEYNLKYFIDPQDKTRLFRLHGGVIDDETYQWTATRVKGGQRIEDFQFYHHLNNSQLLFNRYRWRPELLNEIRDAIDSRLDTATEVLTDIAKNFFPKAGVEVTEKTGGIREIIKNDLAPFFAFLKEKFSAIGTELKAEWQPIKLNKLRTVLSTIFGAFLDTDELVDRLEERFENLHLAIGNLLTRLFDLVSHLDEYADKAGDAISNYLSGLPDKIQALRTTIRAKLPEIMDRVRNFLIKVRDFIEDFVENQYVSKALAKFREIWDKTIGRVREWLRSIFETVFGSDDGKTGLYDRMKNKLYEYAEGDGEAAKVLKGILSAIKSVKEKVKEIFSDICKTYADYRASVIERLTAIYDAADPDLKELIAEIRAKRQKFFAQFHDDEGLKEEIRAYVDKAIGDVKEKMLRFTSSAVFDPRNGRIEFYLPLLEPVESIRTLRHEGFTLQRLLKKEKRHYKDGYFRVKKSVTSGDVLPPFEAHAMLIGDQHYVTYDHRFFDFVGKCQYVLTHDLVDQNFSVIVNYEDVKGKPQKTSIVVVSDSHNIVIKSDYKVLLDEQEVELPNQIEHTHIHREQHAIRVTNNKGFNLVYDLAHNLVMVNVSGWYFGRLGGLFGNYNNEPSDDFHTPDGQNLTNPTLFANSWEVSNRCVAKDNFATSQQATFGSEGYLWCHKMFSSDWSPFHSCFPYTPKDHYLQACLEEVVIRAGELEPADTACRIASAYIDACHHHNVHLELPSKCLRCSLPNGQKFTHGDIQTLKGNDVPKSADVIFIFEQKECNRRILLESLDEVAKELDKELQSSGLTNNQYGIVAFGGEGVQGHAHPHTARGQLFTDARSVVLALKNMGFSGTTPSDAFEAIDLACNYPFRTGVAKSAILFLCDHCSEDSQSVDHSELRHHLLHHGIALHVLTPEEIAVASKPAAASSIIGFDAKTTYKVKDATQKTLAGDAELRPHITDTEDVCQHLAQEVDGSVFKSDQLGTKKQNVGKSVKTVLAKRVVASAKPSSCESCDCVAGPDGVPIPFCSPCSSGKPKSGHDHHEGHGTPTSKDRKKPTRKP